MLYSLRGTLVFRDMQSAAVECGGVAYHCKTSLSTLSKLGKVGSQTLLYTYLQVRNEALDLFGFADEAELDCFRLLTGVTGVGAKAGLSILSIMSPERFALCVASGDYKSITAAPGVGNKLAQRIVLELKDKVQGADFKGGLTELPGGVVVVGAGNAGEAVSALLVLGYSQSEAAAAVGKLDPELPVEELIKAALKMVAVRR